MSGGKPSRRLRFGLSTLLGLKRLGFFIPYRYASGITPPLSYPAIEPAFECAAAGMVDILHAAESHIDQLTDFSRAPEPRPRLAQDWFPGLDAIAAYTLVRRLKPGRIVEIGSGHSTRFLALAAEDEGLVTQIDAIDPAPRADFTAYGRVQLHRHLLADAPNGLWDEVKAGDIVSLDGSHISMPGTDVDHFAATVLPKVAGKAVLHIHDIFLPDAYPPMWAWRGYNEQGVIAALITSGAYRVLWSSRYVRTRLTYDWGASPLSHLPIKDGSIETSLWLTPAK